MRIHHRWLALLHRRMLFQLMTLLLFASTAPSQSDVAKETPVKAEALRIRGGFHHLFGKLRAGQPTTIAYFGGSITEGAGPSKEQNTYRALTTQWFKSQFPTAKITEVNAGIGGTGSDLGVFRLSDDVLSHHPDLIFVEFAVNDSSTESLTILKAMEGIVRQVWKADPQTDLCFIYTYQEKQQPDLENGVFHRAAGLHDQLAEYYGIPAISVALPISQLIGQHKMIPRPPRDAKNVEMPIPQDVVLFSRDGVHPSDAASAIYADTIRQAMPALEAAGRPGPHSLPAPFIADNWEDAKNLPIEARMLHGEWREVTGASVTPNLAHRMPKLWETNSPGAALEFRFKGTAVSIYDMLGPSMGRVRLTLDGKELAAFDSFSPFYRVAPLPIGANLPDGPHTVRLDWDPQQPDRTAFLNREKAKPGFNPSKYEGAYFRPSRILLVGELLP